MFFDTYTTWLLELVESEAACGLASHELWLPWRSMLSRSSLSPFVRDTLEAHSQRTGHADLSFACKQICSE